MGIFFDDTKPHVSPDEFKKVRASLYDHDFTEKEIDTVASFFDSFMFGERAIDKGIDRQEIEQGIETLRKSQNIYHLNDKKLDILKEKLEQYL